MLAQSKGDYE